MSGGSLGDTLGEVKPLCHAKTVNGAAQGGLTERITAQSGLTEWVLA